MKLNANVTSFDRDDNLIFDDTFDFDISFDLDGGDDEFDEEDAIEAFFTADFEV